MTADLRTIDVLHLGQPGVVACFQHGSVLVDPGPGSTRVVRAPVGRREVVGVALATLVVFGTGAVFSTFGGSISGP